MVVKGNELRDHPGDADRILDTVEVGRRAARAGRLPVLPAAADRPGGAEPGRRRARPRAH